MSHQNLYRPRSPVVGTIESAAQAQGNQDLLDAFQRVQDALAGAGGGGLYFSPAFGQAPGSAGLIAMVVGIPSIPELSIPHPSTLKSASIKVDVNVFDGPTVYTVYRNGLATGVTVTIPAGATGIFDLAGAPISFALHDTVALHMDATASTAGGINALTTWAWNGG